MSFLKHIFKKNTSKRDMIDDLLEEAIQKDAKEREQQKAKKLVELEQLKTLNLTSGDIVKVTNDSVLDTSSLVAIKKMQHNLEILINKVKEEGKIDKFMLIRDDNFLPNHWEWEVNSRNTHFEKLAPRLSIQLRDTIALEKAGIINNLDGFELPIDEEDRKKAVAQVDKGLGCINVPVHFRSTKHFTINTPVDVTGDYNPAQAHRNFTIIDPIDSFLTSGYAYSIAWHDAYLDVTHESLPISENAVVLIEESKYHNLIKNPLIANQLKERKVVVYKGEEYMAVNMVLSEMGVLPSQIGPLYAHYDEQLKNILENSIQGLAKKYHLLYDKSHSGGDGHFTDYFDEKDSNQNKSLNEFVAFLNQKFPNQSEMITLRTVCDSYYAEKMIQAIGTKELLHAINEYNQMVQHQFALRHAEYKKNRKTITPQISAVFKHTLHRINQYYEACEFDHFSHEQQKVIENFILHFFQDSTVQEQLLAAKNVWNVLTENKNLESNYNYSNDETIQNTFKAS